jgi:hypothetical protein
MSAFDHDIFTKRLPPVGRGVLKIEGDRVMFYGKYFMSTERGRDAFETVKEMGADSEWSIGWPNSTLKTATMTDEWREKGARRVIAGMNVMEVSPVMLGANQFTRTVATKSADAVVDEEQEQAEAERQRVASEDAAAVEAKRKADIVAAVEQTLATMKAAEEAEAERKRLAEHAEREREAIATKAAEDKAAEAMRKQFAARAEKEFARFHRNMNLYGVR